MHKSYKVRVYRGEIKFYLFMLVNFIAATACFPYAAHTLCGILVALMILYFFGKYKRRA
jgi:hypothetical protein